jgi:hypothetical protein
VILVLLSMTGAIRGVSTLVLSRDAIKLFPIWLGLPRFATTLLHNFGDWRGY